MKVGSQELLETAEAAARAGGQVVLSRYLDDSLEPELKAEHDYVSAADRDSEAAILKVIQERFPEHGVLAEESGRVGASGAEYEWVVDPLDGTANFLQGLPLFAVSVACVHRGRTEIGVILDPVAKSLYSAVRGGGASRDGRAIEASALADLDGAFLATGYPFRARHALDPYLGVFRDAFCRARGIRRMGAAALDLAYTAAGSFDGFFEFRLAPWDIAAGALLIEESGGRVSDLDGGERYLETGNILAGSPGVHAELLEIVSRHVSEARLDELVPLSTAAPAGPC